MAIKVHILDAQTQPFHQAHARAVEYTHRTAISNERIVKITTNQVAFKARADTNGGKRIVKFDAVEFVRRFLLHVLPTELKRIRHYGLLAPSKA